MTLENKVAVVSGVASGIGAAAALAFARKGATIIGLDLQDATDTVAKVEAAGGKMVSVVGDVTQTSVWQQVADSAKAEGGADILINIAGYSQLEDEAISLSEHDWHKLIDVNLKGVWLGVKHITPQLKEAGGGSIVNMSSAAALIGVPNHATYSSAKGAVIAFTQQIAVEYAPFGVRANAVSPGPVDTPMVNTNTPETMEAIVNAVPLKRIAAPEEIAETFLFLCSGAAASITGVNLPIDGGISMSM